VNYFPLVNRLFFIWRQWNFGYHHSETNFQILSIILSRDKNQLLIFLPKFYWEQPWDYF
jgi:hypothetical protein